MTAADMAGALCGDESEYRQMTKKYVYVVLESGLYKVILRQAVYRDS